MNEQFRFPPFCNALWSGLPMKRLHHMEIPENFVSCVVCLVLQVHLCHLVNIFRKLASHTRLKKLRLGSWIAHMAANMFFEGLIFRHCTLIHRSHLLSIIRLILRPIVPATVQAHPFGFEGDNFAIMETLFSLNYNFGVGLNCRLAHRTSNDNSADDSTFIDEIG